MNISLQGRRPRHFLAVSALAFAAALGVGPSTAQAQPTVVVAAPLKIGKKSTIELKSAVMAYAEKATLRASVFAVDGTNRTPVADGDVEFKIGEKVWGTAKTDASGVATLPIQAGLSPSTGPLKTTARFVGKGDILPSVDSSTLGLVKASPRWKAVRAESGSTDVRVEGWLETANAGVGGGRKVTVNVNGKDIKTVDEWSGVNLPFATFAVGQNKVRLQFEGNEFYAPTATEVAFTRKRDTNLYFDAGTPSSAENGKTMKIRVRVGESLLDSPSAAMFLGRSVGVKLIEEHPYFVTQAKVGYRRVEHKAVTDAAGYATFVTTDDWNEVTRREAALAGRPYDHKLSIVVDDDQWRADPKPAHQRMISVKR